MNKYNDFEKAERADKSIANVESYYNRLHLSNMEAQITSLRKCEKLMSDVKKDPTGESAKRNFPQRTANANMAKLTQEYHDARAGTNPLLHHLNGYRVAIGS